MAINAVADKGSVYEVTLTDGTVSWVPKDPKNKDYARIQQWVSGGGVIG